MTMTVCVCEACGERKVCKFFSRECIYLCTECAEYPVAGVQNEGAVRKQNWLDMTNDEGTYDEDAEF
jgi:hypothetical protein